MGCMQSFNLKGEDDGKDDGTGKSPGADKGNAKLGEDVVFGYQTDIKSKYKVRMEWEHNIWTGNLNNDTIQETLFYKKKIKK